MKENDMILNMLANPDFTITDFQSVGLTGENTGLRAEEEYIKSDKIRNNSYFQTEGQFDETKFHNFYVGAGQFYNQLATQNYEEAILDKAQFSKDNLWVEPEKRTIDYAPKLVRLENEHLVTNSLERLGKRGQRTLSQSEIAQTQKVYNIETGEWETSPNDSVFDHFTKTLVLATYDEDEYDDKGNLIYQKGERKLNDEGLPYYETLGGRDVYGKQVLNKFNTITTDDSRLNRYDFFDTDDIEQKSVVGTLMRNATLVGSMFIPGVGPWIAGISVATQTAGLLATFGKLFAGNDSATLNNLQGWVKTVNRSGQTEYAANNTWCTENLLNMIGDTVGQLKEQRWIFSSVPALMGYKQAAKALSGEKGYNKVLKQVEKELAEKGTAQTTKNLLKYVDDPKKYVEIEGIAKSFQALNKQNAIKKVDDLIDAATKLSSPIARAYMVGITVQDTYGEAKAAGASDLEAALLTVGYAAGEAMILNTELGKWIMPEAQAGNYKHKAIAKVLSKDIKDAYGQLAKDGSKQTFTQKVLNFGRDIAQGHYAQQAISGGKTLVAHALTEATEEVSEELLADVSKSIFNVTRWLRGEDALDLGEWDNSFDRYTMSALGGLVGGGIASAGTSFKQARDLSQMDKTQAMHEILYMINNGKEGEFINQLEKMDFGNKHLSAKNIIEYTEDGIPIYAEGDQKDNQDREIKNVIKGQIKLAKDILEGEGAKLSTQSLLNKLTLEDQKDVMKQLRYINLQNARSLDLYLNDFAEIQSSLVSKTAELMKLTTDVKDSVEDNVVRLKKIEAINQELAALRVKKDAYSKGQVTPEAIRDAVFELNPLINGKFLKTNLKMYAEHKLGKKWEGLSDTERKDITQAYKTYSETTMKNDIHTRAAMYQDMLELFSNYAAEAQDFINNIKQQQGTSYENLLAFATDMFSEKYDEGTDYIAKMQQKLVEEEARTAAALGTGFFSEESFATVYNALEMFNNKELPLDQAQEVILNEITNILDGRISEFVNLQYIHPEVKHSLNNILDLLNRSAGNIFNAKMQDLYEAPDLGTPEWNQRMQELIQQAPLFSEQIKEYKNQINSLRNTPIIEYLNKFQLSTTNSDLNLTKHLETTLTLIKDAKQNNSLDELLADPDWEIDNEEALLLIDSFIAVMDGLRVDNADVLNPIGYSRILNDVYQRSKIQNYVKLAELDSQTADLMLQDALLIKQKLEFVQNVHDLNKGQKLKQQEKVAINKQYLTFNALKHWVKVAVPDEWKEKLQSLIDSSEQLNKLSQDDLNLSKEDKTKVNLEMLKIEDAIYDLFNEKSLDQSSIEDMLKSFAGLDGFFQKTGDPLTEYSKFLDNNSFIWWLASKAAMKTSDFYGAYIKSLTDDLAPIASQELAVQLGVAAITNMGVLNKFVDAYRNTVIKEFNNIKDINKRKQLLNMYHKGSDSFADQLLGYFASYNAIPQFQNMVFIEGIPGSGKSKGVFKSIKAVVDQIDPTVFENAIYAHATSESAKEAGDGIDLKTFRAFNREQLMNYISSEWRDVLKNPKNKDKKVYLYDDSYDFVDGKLVNKWKINKVSDAPRVMFVDEITHFNQQELSMLEQFVKENNTVILTAGDLDQDSLISYFTDKSGKNLDVSIDRNYFIRTPKLGLTLRALNKQMSHDVLMLQAVLQKLKQGESVSIDFTYLDNDGNHKGLYGVKSVESLEKAKDTIQLMIDTSIEPVGYIYQDENSDLYKYLEENFKDKIKFFKGSEAQGLEGQYYIIEPNTSNGDIFAKSLYTGISRSEQGALVVTPSGVGNITNITSVLDPNFQLEPLPPQAITKASKNRKEELEELLQGYQVKSLEIVIPEYEESITPKKEDFVLPPVIESENIVDDAIVNSDLENEVEQYEEMIVAENVTEEEVPEDSFTLYTFNDFQMGVDLEDGKIVYKGEHFEERIDNAIGLMNLFGYKPGDSPTKIGLSESTSEEDIYKYLEQTIADLGNATLYYNNEELLNTIKGALNLDGNNLQLIYAIKSTTGENSASGYGRYYKGKSEKAKHIYSDDPYADIPLKKDLVLLVKNNDNVIFELSLGTLNSPLTKLQQTDLEGNLIYEEAYKIYNDIYDKNVDDSQYKAINEIISKLDKQPKYKNLVNLFKLWQFSSNGIFYFGQFDKITGKFTSSSFSLNKAVKFGPQLVKTRGGRQLNGKLQFNNKIIDLDAFAANPKNYISSIFTVNENIHGINKGHSFVLVSNNPKIRTDEDLTREFAAGNKDVSKFYVVPPKAEISEWIDNEHSRYLRNLGNNVQVQEIGNGFTAYRILQALIESGKFDSFNSSDGTKQEVKQAIADLENIENKWSQPTIEFSGEILERNLTDTQLFEEYQKKYQNESLARRAMRIVEQRTYLDKKNNWGKVPITPDKTINQALTSYLTGIVYKKVITGSKTPSFTEDLTQLQRLNEACALGGLKNVYYRPIKSKENIGPHKEFIKILTSDKYTMFSKNGKDYKFQIAAKIDTTSLSYSVIAEEIAKFTNSKSDWSESTNKGSKHRTTHFYFDGKTWKLTDLGKKAESDYLGMSENPNTQTTSFSIKSKYSKWFNSGLLNESLIIEGDEINSLRRLADELNSRKIGIYGFEYAGQLYLYEFNDLIPNIISNTLDNNELLQFEGVDSEGNIHKYTVEPTVNDNFVSRLELRETITKFNQAYSFAQLNDTNAFYPLKDVLVEYNSKIKTNFGKKLLYLQKIQSLGDLINIIDSYNQSLNQNFNGQQLIPEKISADIDYMIKKLELLIQDEPTKQNCIALLKAVQKSIEEVESLQLDQYNQELEETICKPKILKLLSK